MSSGYNAVQVLNIFLGWVLFDLSETSFLLSLYCTFFVAEMCESNFRNESSIDDLSSESSSEEEEIEDEVKEKDPANVAFEFLRTGIIWLLNLLFHMIPRDTR